MPLWIANRYSVCPTIVGRPLPSSRISVADAEGLGSNGVTICAQMYVDQTCAVPVVFSLITNGAAMKFTPGGAETVGSTTPPVVGGNGRLVANDAVEPQTYANPRSSIATSNA